MAVKIIKLSDEHIPFLKKGFKQAKKLNHPNIIKHKSMYFDYKKYVCYLVMEYVDVPNLVQAPTDNESDLKIVASQIFDVLIYMHKNDICHRDIKPDNLLFDRKTKTLKVIDFGICKTFLERGRKQQMMTPTGTLFYRAPQMFHGSGYNQTVDIWATGVTLYKLVTGKTPFQAEYLSDTIENIEKRELNFNHKSFKQYSSMVQNFISRLIRRNTVERLTAEQAKKHFWFDPQETSPDSLTRSDSFNLYYLKAYQEFTKPSELNEGKKVKFYEENDMTKLSASESLPAFKDKEKMKKFFSNFNIDEVEEKEFASDEENENELGMDLQKSPQSTFKETSSPHVENSSSDQHET